MVAFSTTSVRAARPRSGRGKLTPAVTTPGHARTDSIDAPAGIPLSAAVHSAVPVRTLKATTVRPNPIAATWPPAAAYACPWASTVPPVALAVHDPGSSRVQRILPADPQRPPLQTEDAEPVA